MSPFYCREDKLKKLNMGLIFEKMCQDYLLYYEKDLPFEMREIGQKKHIQIDLVGMPIAGRDYIIGSCKYRKPSAKRSTMRRNNVYTLDFENCRRTPTYDLRPTNFFLFLFPCLQNQVILSIAWFSRLIDDHISIQPCDSSHDAPHCKTFPLLV